MNAPVRQPVIGDALAPLTEAERLRIAAQVALRIYDRDLRAYKAGRCDDPVPCPTCWHVFPGETAATLAVRVDTPEGPAFVRRAEVHAAADSLVAVEAEATAGMRSTEVLAA